MPCSPAITPFVDLLCSLIGIPSISREEGPATDFLEGWMKNYGLSPRRIGNNLLLCDEPLDVPSSKPTLLLNAHIDTVRPAKAYTRDPFTPTIVDEPRGKVLYGLGSNDDGGSLVALLQTYLILRERPQPYRLIYAATAEEEVCGVGGMDMVIPYLGEVDLGIIGEPTGMQMAVGERGLMVLDCVAHGKSGHAARSEGVNAIYEALRDIEWFRTYEFPLKSEVLGPVKMTVTIISAGTAHNVVPAECTFTVDVRPNGMYTNVELLSLIRERVGCDVTPRSTRLGSSNIPSTHPVVVRGKSLGMTCFGSPTTSNQAVCPFTTLKIGPGDSARSHTADEFIILGEIEDGVNKYVALLDGLELR